MYKISMLSNPGRYQSWITMTEETEYDRAKKTLENYRKATPRREFRLELHTMTILED
jgi:hypothetical protein